MNRYREQSGMFNDFIHQTKAGVSSRIKFSVPLHKRLYRGFLRVQN